MIRNNQRKPGTISSLPTHYRSKEAYDDDQNLGQSLSGQSDFLMGSTQILSIRKNSNFERDRQGTKEKQQLPRGYQVKLAGKGLSSLEAELEKATGPGRVQSLDLSQNCLSFLPPNILHRLVNLTEMQLSHNCIEKISFPYFKHSRLAKMGLSHNQLASLNLEHLSSMITLDCSHNQLTFLTLPAGINHLDCNHNQLSSLYFIEHCSQLREARLSHNRLYDLRLSFKSYSQLEDSFPHLALIDCSQNKVQYFEGLRSVANLSTLRLDHNEISLTRDMINELLSLQKLEDLQIGYNPIEGGGFSCEEIFSLFLAKMSCLKRFNDQDLEEARSERSFEGSAGKSNFSGIMDEPYQLFMQPSQERSGSKKAARQLEWNFTLGDCDTESARESKINDLSLIKGFNQGEAGEQKTENAEENGQGKAKGSKGRAVSAQGGGGEDQKMKEVMRDEDRQLPVRLIRSSSPLALPHHIHYKPFLQSLLPMSYIPATPILKGASKVSSRRLEEQDDDYLLIARMFENRGGVVYVKKISAWAIQQDSRQLFRRHKGTASQSYMGFLLNQTSEQQFREYCRSNKLVPISPRQIVGTQPNVFSCFHLIARCSPQTVEKDYLCAYLVESTHL